MYDRNAENEIKNDIIEGRNAVIEALRVGNNAVRTGALAASSTT